MDSFEKIKKLEAEISALKDKIKEKESNLPAHSIRPEMIQEIEDLEEELNSKRKKLKQIKSRKI
jgi:predicted  nucleic acid-binding Zn-ribbon protein